MQGTTIPTQEQGWFTRERMMTLALIAGTALACAICFLLMLPFLPALTWAMALALLSKGLIGVVLRIGYVLCRFLLHFSDVLLFLLQVLSSFGDVAASR